MNFILSVPYNYYVIAALSEGVKYICILQFKQLNEQMKIDLKLNRFTSKIYRQGRLYEFITYLRVEL